VENGSPALPVTVADEVRDTGTFVNYNSISNLTFYLLTFQRFLAFYEFCKSQKPKSEKAGYKPN
jgi:hypothetical protein